MGYIKHCLYICLYVLISFSGLGQEIPKISYLGTSQGLSNSSVLCIFQDSKGFMWFGTYDGLNRYDGYDMKVFRNHFNDSTSIPHNYIYAIGEDADKNLWVGTGQGLVVYNSILNTFDPVYYRQYNTQNREKIVINVNAILKDKNGNMFVGTNGWGLLVKGKNEDVAFQIPFRKKDGSTGTYSSAQNVVIDNQGRVWVFINGEGLYQYDYSIKRMEPINNSFRNHIINRMMADGKGNLWFGTNAGLIQYSICENSIVSTLNAEKGELNANYVSEITLDENGDFWIGTDGGGVDILNKRSGKIKKIENELTQSLLTSNSVLSIYIDKESRKWIGTQKGGIDIVEGIRNNFLTKRREPGNINSPSGNFISAFLEDTESDLWVGTDGSGISIWNVQRSHFTNIVKPALSNNSITGIIQDYHRNVWISTYGGGMNKVDKQRNIKSYKLIDDNDGIENKIVIAPYMDSHQNLWAITFENGKLYLYNRDRDRFEVFDREIGDLLSILEDSRGALWVGNHHQLIKVDRQNKDHQYFEIGKPIRAIFEDSDGNFWIGTEGGGLILFDCDEQKIKKRYTEDDGLSSNSVMCILEDESKNLWMSTSNGITKFIPSKSLFYKFYESDGLQGNEFSFRGALKLKSGKLVFGGNNGFTLFNPELIQSRSYMPSVVITDFKVNGRYITDADNYRTDTSGNLSAITVPFDDATLSLQFAALEFTSPQKIQYEYYLEGWDRNWNKNTGSRTISYNNIREGTYKLRIKSTNAEGEWNSRETIIQLRVLPPWYRTWWAYILYFLIIGTVTYVYRRYRTKLARMKYRLRLSKFNEEKREAELEREKMEKEIQHAELERERMEKKMQQAELEKTQAMFEREKAEHETERVTNEKEREINQKQLSFFTSISHEFRTPLTMIINPIKDILHRYEGEEKEELQVIGRNSKRLLSLTNQLLLFRRIEEGAGALRLSHFDFSKLCKTVYLYFSYEAQTKDIQYDLMGVDEPISFYGDKDKMEIVLYNLISNAFKYTPEGGHIGVKITRSKSCLLAEIADSGIGIPEEIGDAIFERFYQAKDNNKSGFGIGLYMVKQFIDMHEGAIAYKSEVGKGTVFTLKLKIGKAHFAGKKIDEDKYENKFLNIGAKDKQNHAMKEVEVPILTDNKALLIVDDDAEIQNYVASIFSKNYVVYKASNGIDGMKIVREKKPDLVISDITMPKMDGIELCRRIKSDNAINHIPVILLTAHASQEVELKGTEEGANYYVTKPFNKELLIAQVNSLFRSRSNLQQYFFDRATLRRNKENSQKVPAEYQELLDRCIEIIEEHMDDNNFNIEMLTREMGMSHSFLYKRIKEITGQTLNSFIRFLRLRKAAEMFINTNFTISEVAYKVGFGDLKYFREQFVKVFKMKPNEYIAQYRGATGDNSLRIS